MVTQMIHNQHFNFYIASCSTDGGILFCKFLKDGVKILDKTHLDRPMYMIKNDSKMHILLRDPYNINESSLVSFTQKNGFLTQREKIISTKGSVACHLCYLNNAIYCVNYLSGNVVKLPETIISHKGHGIDPKRQEMPHTHYINTFDGKYLLCTDLGTDEIYTYDKDLNEISRIKLLDGHGPRHLDFSNGKVYCLNELKSTLSILDYNSGSLILKETISVLPEDYTGQSTAAAIRSKDGFIYTSNRGHNSISVLKPDEDSVKLIKTVDCGGVYPRDFNIFGDVLVCANELSDNVTFFQLINGIPEKLDVEINIKSPICII